MQKAGIRRQAERVLPESIKVFKGYRAGRR
jgi:hypothetical protein